MEDFDGLEDFDNVELPKNTFSNNTDGNNNDHKSNSFNNNNSKRDFKQYVKKPKRNIVGEAKLNLWDKDKIVPLELDNDKFKEDVKYFTIALPSETFKLNEDNLKKISTILKLLKDKEYKARFICNFNRAIYSTISEIFEEDNIELITPWESYCKDSKETTRLFIPTDLNIQTVSSYVNNFFNLNPSLQYIYGGIFTSIYGQENTKPSNFVIIFDPFKTDPKAKVDFKLSKNTANYILLGRKLNYPLYNLANESDYAAVEQILL